MVPNLMLIDVRTAEEDGWRVRVHASAAVPWPQLSKNIHSERPPGGLHRGAIVRSVEGHLPNSEPKPIKKSCDDHAKPKSGAIGSLLQSPSWLHDAAVIRIN